MAILAVPFALSMGKRGGLVGIATAIGVAIAYWFIAGVFSAMGNINTLPPSSPPGPPTSSSASPAPTSSSAPHLTLNLRSSRNSRISTPLRPILLN